MIRRLEAPPWGRACRPNDPEVVASGIVSLVYVRESIAAGAYTEYVASGQFLEAIELCVVVLHGS